MQTVEKLF